MDIVTHLVISLQQVAVLIFGFVSIVLFSRTLYIYKFRNCASLRIRKLSMCMISYMVFNIVGITVSTPYYIYKLFFDETSPDVKFWVLLFATSYLTVMPLTVLFLALERCLTIHFKFSTRIEIYVFICKIFAVITVIAANFSRLNNNVVYMHAFKATLGSFNTWACVFICYKIKQFKIKNWCNTKNVIVKFTCISELCLETLPNLVAVILLTVFGSGIFSHTGPFASTTQWLNVMFCAIIYSKTLHAKKKQSTWTKPQHSSKIYHT
ncbi:hypothetical protein DdX_10090 [Ditylenchus destructor]|uniref:Uncharacterized protein n=1 Tax=Ditylenchus destructor TaxID=166010 RepID=A0AAD4R5K2_9BILA|nr:hypothetical protein DdX_10090 [Ditylenchus destructor]